MRSLRVVLAGLLFAQAIRWAWSSLEAFRAPVPYARTVDTGELVGIRVTPLTGAERNAALEREWDPAR